MEASFIFFLLVLPLVMADLRVGFYQSTCPQAESIVSQVVKYRFNTDPSLPAALLRMHFHDCFVTVLRFSSLNTQHINCALNTLV